MKSLGIPLDAEPLTSLRVYWLISGDEDLVRLRRVWSVELVSPAPYSPDAATSVITIGHAKIVDAAIARL